jgi:TonB family protein
MAKTELLPVNADPHGLPDLNRALEQQISAGFPPELALDLALHELVVRAASATRASAAALALVRGNEMVCRAATGLHAPDLGVPLNTRDGLSGACLRTREAQLCSDAEADPLVDARAAHRLGIRSMLIVPVFQGDALIGVLEVFSPELAAFSGEDQELLESLARDCARVCRAVLEESEFPLSTASSLASILPAGEPESPSVPDLPPVSPSPPPSRLYNAWTVILATLTILLSVALSFMTGYRAGWLRVSPARLQAPAPVSAAPGAPQPSPVPSPAQPPASARSTLSQTIRPNSRLDELVVYDHGKVIFRMRRALKNGDSVVAASERTRLKAPIVWLAPSLAERLLRTRVEPAYPSEAIAAHRSGDVVLNVVVAEDGSVASIRTRRGDPLLYPAAADAVRNWRYQPYRSRQHPARFQTDVTLRFSLPESD